MRVSFVLFDGFTALDAIGAYEVLSRIPGLEVEFAAIDRGIVAADTRRLGLLAYRTLNEIRSTDVLIVPGGPGVRALESDADFLAELRRLDASSQWTVGICNGVTLLAAAGLLEGKKATTNWFDREYIERYGVEFVPERYYREDKYVTGAGVSASIDTAFFLARMIAGDSVARAIQLGIEYYPTPPSADSSPWDAPAKIQQVVQHYEEGAGSTLLKMPPVFGALGMQAIDSGEQGVMRRSA